MTVRIPALPDEGCPYCGAASIGGTRIVWRVADQDGLHYECDRCKHDWRATDGTLNEGPKDGELK